MKNKKINFWKHHILIEIFVSLVILTIVSFIAISADLNAAEKKLNTTVEYLKDQCNSSELRDLASESKSLLRVSESVEYVSWRLLYNENNHSQNLSQEELLKDSADNCYLNGIALLNTDGKILADYNSTSVATSDILAEIDTPSLLDVASFKEKHYSIRIPFDNRSHIDVAAISRSDQPGIIVGFFQTSAEYAHTFNNGIISLVNGFVPEYDGTIIISSGNQIIASNNNSLIGTSTNDLPITKRIMKDSTGKNLIHTQDAENSFQRSFGLMEKSQNYYIYAYLPERSVFTSTPATLLFTLFICVIVIALLHLLKWHTERTSQQAQLRMKEKYTRHLENKNRQLEHAVLQTKQANETKSRFLSSMSHDIRTPLNGIIGFLKIDEANFDDPDVLRSNHEKIMISANHLLSLINDVLQMSKLDDDAVHLAHKKTDLSQLTIEIVTIIKQHADENGLQWNFDREASSSPISYPYVYGSPLHLRQIFLNIYGNCIKYNKPNGSITTKIHSLGYKDGIVTYQWIISDTGIGMSEEFLQHIFEPFSQENSDARTNYNGVGLGMSIVRSLIEKMNGTLEVKSQKDVGSTFIITLPFEVAEEPDTPLSVSSESASIHDLHPLMAEDNEINAEIAKTLLTERDATVVVVPNGLQAVQAFKRSKPGYYDAILMDIMMPVMDGITAAREIRSLDHPDTKTIPILAVTANAFQEDAQKCIDAGMNMHFAKPLNMDDVVAALSRLCKKH